MKKLFIDARGIYNEMDGLSFYSMFLIHRIYEKFCGKIEMIVCLSPTAKNVQNIFSNCNRNFRLIFSKEERFGNYEYNFEGWESFISKLTPDIYISTAFFQTEYKCPKAVVIHDLIPIVSEKLKVNKKTFYFKVIAHAVKNSDLIITPSSFTKYDIINHYSKLDLPPIIVLHPDIREIIKRVSEKKAIEINNALVMIGVKCPRKNVELVIGACRILKGYKAENCKVFFIGKIRNDDVPIKEMIDQHGLNEYAEVMGYVNDAELVNIIRGSKGLLFPSTYEGFGIPIVEFLACRKPVICLKCTSIPEVAGDMACYVENSPKHLADAMIKTINNEPIDSWKDKAINHVNKLSQRNDKQFNALFSWIGSHFNFFS